MAFIQVFQGDLPTDIKFPKMVAVDSETTGLDVVNDKLHKNWLNH